jgi:hypothetical protein
MDGECDECGSRLHHRADDNEETIDRRLRVYEMQTQSITDKYQQQGKLHIIDASGAIEDVTRGIKSALRGLRPKRFNLKATQAIQSQSPATAKKLEVIRTQVDKNARTPTKPRREALAMPDESAFTKRPKPAPAPQKKTRPAKKATAKTTAKKDNKAQPPEAMLDHELKALQDELKAVQDKLKQEAALEKKLIEREKKAAAKLKKQKS